MARRPSPVAISAAASAEPQPATIEDGSSPAVSATASSPARTAAAGSPPASSTVACAYSAQTSDCGAAERPRVLDGAVGDVERLGDAPAGEQAERLADHQLEREHRAAGAAGDRRAAREVLQRERELAEEVLRPAEEQQHLQARAELLVVERGDQQCRLEPALAALLDVAERVRGHRQRGGRGRHQRGLVQGLRARERLGRALAHLERVPAQ